MDGVHREVERTYQPGQDARLPPLDQLPGVAHVEPPAAQELEAVYFDTSDRVLAHAGITLCRRTGGDGAGWHLKLPAGDGASDELRVPWREATETGVPHQLRSAVRVHIRDRAMAPVSTLRTRRSVSSLIDSDGRVLAVLCDDNVTAHTPAPADTGLMTAWREWEIELVDGQTSLLEAADELLRRAGAKPAAAPSKLDRVLGCRIPQPTSPSKAVLSRGGTASAVVHARLREQVAELKLRDPEVRRDVPDAVHKMRVAIRRLRSALATFRPLLDRQVTARLREELKWHASVLGEARDVEILRERLGALIAEEPAELELDQVAAHVGRELGGTYRNALAQSVEAMDSDRYLRLLDGLDRLIAEPPWTPLAGQPARKVLPGRVRHDWKRQSRVVAVAENPRNSAERNQLLHEVRKAGKRVRYAAEALVPVYGRDAKRLANATGRLQSVLGDHHDSVVAQDRLRQFAVQAHLNGDSAFIYGRLHAREQARTADTEAEFTKAWRKVSRKKLRRWLR